MVSLKEHHRPTEEYVRQLRLRLNQQFPGSLFYFLPSDIVTQTINFGLPAPFDIQIVGRNIESNRAEVAALAEKARHVRGAVDVRAQQPGNLQRLAFDIDRTKASEIGLSEHDIAGAILLGLAGSSQVQPGYWLDSRIGVQYLVNVRAPEYRMDSLADLKSMPITATQPGTEAGQLLTNLASFRRTNSSPIYSLYNVMPVVVVFGAVSGRDLAGVLDDLRPLIADGQKNLPAGSTIILRGQTQTMRSSFIGLGVGLVAANGLIYLLLVVNCPELARPIHHSHRAFRSAGRRHLGPAPHPTPRSASRR